MKNQFRVVCYSPILCPSAHLASRCVLLARFDETPIQDQDQLILEMVASEHEPFLDITTIKKLVLSLYHHHIHLTNNTIPWSLFGFGFRPKCCCSTSPNRSSSSMYTPYDGSHATLKNQIRITIPINKQQYISLSKHPLRYVTYVTRIRNSASPSLASVPINCNKCLYANFRDLKFLVPLNNQWALGPFGTFSSSLSSSSFAAAMLKTDFCAWKKISDLIVLVTTV